MRLPTALLLVFITVPSIAAQSFTDFPPCAQTCITIAIRASGCDYADRSCVCRNSVYLNTVEQCELDTCDEASIAVAPKLARQYCNSTGIDLTNVHTTNPADIISANSTIPICGQNCQIRAFAESGCNAADFECICKNQVFKSSVNQCETSNCTAAEHDKLIQYGAQLCSLVPGATFPTPNAADNGLGKTNLTLTSIFDEPLCAQGPAVKALEESDCKPTDFGCICRSPLLAPGTLGKAQAQACGEFDNQVLLVQSAQACSDAGVHLLPSNGNNTSPFANSTNTTLTRSALPNNPTLPYSLLNSTTSAPSGGPTAPYTFLHNPSTTVYALSSSKGTAKYTPPSRTHACRTTLVNSPHASKHTSTYYRVLPHGERKKSDWSKRLGGIDSSMEQSTIYGIDANVMNKSCQDEGSRSNVDHDKRRRDALGEAAAFGP